MTPSEAAAVAAGYCNDCYGRTARGGVPFTCPTCRGSFQPNHPRYAARLKADEADVPAHQLGPSFVPREEGGTGPAGGFSYGYPVNLEDS